MIWYAAPTPPDGFTECNGQSTVAYPALATIVGATVPDLRGEFIRGWDHSRNVDTGRSFGSWQSDEIKSHNHSSGMYGPRPADGTVNVFPTTDPWGPAINTGYTGGNETRPRNIALLPCIKY